MADQTDEHEYELEVVEDVDWQVDADGVEYFVEDGVRYELGEDGYAYPVEDGVTRTARSAGDEAGPGATEASAAAATPAPDPGPSTRRPLAASGSITAPRAPGDGSFRWPTPSTAQQPSEPVPSPFSREGEALRSEPPAGDAEVTTEMARPIAPAPQPAGPSGNGHGELLRLDGVRSGYGTLPVLHGVEMSVAAGETAVLLGLNGAGKTTTAMNICGALKTWDGTITFDGQDITSWSTRKAVDAGVVMVPEGRRVFPDLSVAKNLQMGGWSQRKDHDWLDEQRERVFGYFPRLRERASQLAGTLSGGEQQMLAIARGLMARPKLLIIDEASMGLAPVIVADVFRIVSQINEDGTTVLMIEQNVAALEVADVAYVMEQGRMVRELRGDAVHDLSQVSDVLMG